MATSTFKAALFNIFHISWNYYTDSEGGATRKDAPIEDYEQLYWAFKPVWAQHRLFESTYNHQHNIPGASCFKPALMYATCPQVGDRIR